MADTLNFSHNVEQIPAGAALPKTERTTKLAGGFDVPDLQGAISNYAADTNWMSDIGATVAARSSDAIAQKIGGELGKNPQGDIGIPLTDFDKVMQESYVTQAGATLGLQANKLITEANIETAKADRITPDLIKRTNSSIAIGLKNIFQNAPAQLVPKLEEQYGNYQLKQTAQLTDRMFREQKEDRHNNTILATQMNAEHAYSFGLSGDEKAGFQAIENSRKLVEADVAAHAGMTPQQAKVVVDTARKSYLNGKMVHEYEAAKAQGKGEAYLRSIAEKKPGYLSDEDYEPVTQNLLNYVNHQNALRNQNQSLLLAKFQNSVALNPMAPDMFQQLQDLKMNVNAISYENAQLHYINAVKKFNQQNGSTNNALASWNDPSAGPRLTKKGINNAFYMQIDAYVEQSNKQGKPISIEEAKVQVAASAGFPIPAYKEELENNLTSGNPISILSASNQIEMLNHMEQGRVYNGISQKAKAIATLFQQQRGSMPDTDLARKITDNLSNIDETMQKTLDNAWNLQLATTGASGIGASNPFYKMALNEVELVSGKDYSAVGGQYFAVIYGNDIYNQLHSNFIATRGDYKAALKMTKDYVEQHYGDTYVNGKKQKTDSPIEKYLGYPGDDITPFVQQDILTQLSVSFAEAKKNYPTDYWETLPFKGDVAEVVRTVITKEGKKDVTKKYRYPINLVGRAGNQWDVVAQTPFGASNLFLVAPHIGVTTYQPNRDAIINNYKAHKKKGWF